MALEQKMISILPEELEQRGSYRLLTSIVVPRPIAWVSTLGVDGTPNLAPFSFFNGVCGKPPVVMFSISPRSGEPKDTLHNAQANREFVVNVVDESLAEAMNLTAGAWPYGVSEFELAKLETAPSVDVRPPRVAAALVALEAKVTQIVPVLGTTSIMVLGRVVRVHLREGLLRPDGTVDPELLRPVARLGGDEYTTLGRVFSMKRPEV